MRACPELVEAFGRIATAEQAELQIGRAYEYIRARTKSDCARLFTYPYGQVSEYLANHYLPAQDKVWAGFTTEARPLEQGADIWRLPRYVCGWDWKSNDELKRILFDEG